MVKFKGYNKKATSDTMLRIDKRERIMACILGGALLKKMPPEQALKKLNPKSHNLEWQSKNLVQLTIYEHESNKDYFDWKISIIKETGWLKNFKTWKKDDILYASWHDTRKLRIYYKWIYKSHKKTFEQVLKYMHSPLFAAILVMDNGAINQSKEIVINLGLNYGKSAELLQQWFKDILGIHSEVIKTPSSHYLSFDQTGTRKLLSQIKPILKNIPSMYNKVYPHADQNIS